MPTAQESTKKAAFRRFHDATNSHDPNGISETVDEHFEPDVVLHNPGPVQTLGAQAVKEVFSGLHHGYPRWRQGFTEVYAKARPILTTG
jgi:SnoaL-like domain